MVNLQTSSRKIIQSLQGWYLLLRSDANAVTQARQFCLGLLVCLAILWSGLNLYIEPKQKALQQKNMQHREMTASAPEELHNLFTASRQQLEKENQQLSEKIHILEQKEKFIREDWQIRGDSDRFNRILFTLYPSAPVSIEDSLAQMTLLKKRSLDSFVLYPATIEGECSFERLFSYLQYLEQQPEIGLINDLVIEGNTEEYDESPIRFSMIVSRVSLK